MLLNVETREHLCLSPLTLQYSLKEKVLLAGPWCLNATTQDLLDQAGIPYTTVEARVLSKEQFMQEADQCMTLYEKYVGILSKELNQLHQTGFSERYWNTVLNRFLYPLIASVMDKYFLLEKVRKDHPHAVADIIDVEGSEWVDPHTIPGFGSSRLIHLVLFSIVVDSTKLIPCRTVDSATVRQNLERMGDGKKDLRSRPSVTPSWAPRLTRYLKQRLRRLSTFRRAVRGELPLWMFPFTKSPVLALGDQYLPPYLLKRLLIQAGGSRFYFQPQEWDKSGFRPTNIAMRKQLIFPKATSALERALQESLRWTLPTPYMENFDKAQREMEALRSKKQAVILNSQHANGRELVDFYIAHSVEENKSRHVMICHGGCFGTMEISVQDQIWAQIADHYALWSNPKSYGHPCQFVKMPSLRFHKWRGFNDSEPLGRNILMFLTGHYPSRYAYNSIFPYTIDETYDDWQIRFLSAVAKQHAPAFVIRDYHRSGDLGLGRVQSWALAHGVRISAESPMEEALRHSKLAVQTVPQTTYLETISANHPTLCYWNPEANYIRRDLQPYYDRLEAVGVLHYSPESAARTLNDIADDPSSWWLRPDVQDALGAFRENVCLTAPDAIDQWARFISQKAS